MTFKEAFAKARKEKGAGKTFTWQGKSYSTNYAEETKDSGPKRPKAKPETEGDTKASRPRPKPRASAASTPKVETKALPRQGASGRGDGRAEVTRRRADKAISKAERANAGASMKPAQSNTRGLHAAEGGVGGALKRLFSKLPRANSYRN